MDWLWYYSIPSGNNQIVTATDDEGEEDEDEEGEE